MTEQIGLFAEPDRAAGLEPPEKLSAGKRLTQRQRLDIEHGRHPLTRGPLSADPSAACGNCRFRVVLAWHSRSYPKCVWDRGDADVERRYYQPPFVSHSATSDVRAWWPACRWHEYGDNKLSPDAARSGPQDQEQEE